MFMLIPHHQAKGVQGFLSRDRVPKGDLAELAATTPHCISLQESTRIILLNRIK